MEGREGYPQSTTTTAKFITLNDIETCTQRAAYLYHSLNFVVQSGDVAGASRIAGQAAEAENQRQQLQTRFEAQISMFDAEKDWAIQQNKTAHSIKTSIAARRIKLNNAQQNLYQHFNHLSLSGSIHEVRYCIHEYQKNLEGQKEKVKSLGMSSHPSSSDAEQAAALASDPSQSWLSIQFARKEIVDHIETELKYANQLTEHIDEFHKFLLLIRRPMSQPPSQSSSPRTSAPPFARPMSLVNDLSL